MLTGSRIGLAAACAHWLSPGAPPVPPEDADRSRDHGTIVHVGVATLDRSWTPPQSLTRAQAESARRCVGHVLDWYEERAAAGCSVLPEAGYRYNVGSDSARTGSPRMSSGYDDVLPGEIPLTVDAVIQCGCGCEALTAVEVKTGRWHAEHVWQARTAALALAREAGKEAALAVILYVDEDGVFALKEELDVFALDAHAAALRGLVWGLRERSDPEPGPHCTALYCPIRTVCRASTAALARVAAAFPVLPEIVNDDQARAVLAAIPLAEAAIAGWKQRLRDYARLKAVRLRRSADDGALVESDEVYGWREHPERRVRPITAERRQRMDEILGPDLAAAAVETTVEATVGSLEEACRAAARARKAAGEPVKIGAETERIMGALAAADVLTVTQHERCEVFRLKPEKGR